MYTYPQIDLVKLLNCDYKITQSRAHLFLCVLTDFSDTHWKALSHLWHLKYLMNVALMSETLPSYLGFCQTQSLRLSKWGVFSVRQT